MTIAGQHHVAEERGDDQEDGRQDPGHAAQSCDLVHHEPVRDLVRARVRRRYRRRAPSRSSSLRDHLVDACAVGEGERHVVEGALQVEGGQRARSPIHTTP